MIRIETINDYADEQRDGEIPFLELVSCTKYSFFKETTKKVIPTDKYELFCVLSGCVCIANIKKRIDKNGILLIRQFSRTKLEIEENTELVHICFAASPMLPILNNETNQTFSCTFTNTSLINKLYRLSCNKKVLPGIKEAVLLELLNDINDHSTASHSEFSLYLRACDWIENNSSRAITSQDVAAAMGCSRAHLNRVVKMISGECLSGMIARYRLERVKNLCDSGNVSVTEVAQRLDFYSTELLCKFFKYHEGVSISKYMKRE